MNDDQIKTLEQVREFLTGTSAVEFSISSKEERYKWIEQTLIRFRYRSRGSVRQKGRYPFVGRPTGRNRKTRPVIRSNRLINVSDPQGRFF